MYADRLRYLVLGTHKPRRALIFQPVTYVPAKLYRILGLALVHLKPKVTWMYEYFDHFVIITNRCPSRHGDVFRHFWWFLNENSQKYMNYYTNLFYKRINNSMLTSFPLNRTYFNRILRLQMSFVETTGVLLANVAVLSRLWMNRLRVETSIDLNVDWIYFRSFGSKLVKFCKYSKGRFFNR